MTSRELLTGICRRRPLCRAILQTLQPSTPGFAVEPDAPFDVLPFSDSYSYGACQGQTNCSKYFQQAIADAEAGNYEQAIVDALDGIDCILAGGTVSILDKIKERLEGLKR